MTERAGGDFASCTVCGDPLPVDELYAGAAGMVCLPCAAEAVAGFETFESGGRADDALWLALERALVLLPARTPFARSGRVIDAALALARGDAGRTRRVATLAGQLARHDRAAAAYDSLAALGEPTDAAYAAYHWFCRGRATIGLTRLAGLDVDALDGPAQIVVRLNRSALALAGAPDAAAVARAADDLDAVERLIDAEQRRMTRARERTLRASLQLGRGRVALARGDAAAARELLVAAIELGEARPFALTLLGDAAAAAGRRDEAEAAWADALEAAHPESHEAAEARSRLAAPYR